MKHNGGKTRKVNSALKDWVTFVKKVQKEEHISYREAMSRAKARKDKGEKWQMGGNIAPASPIEHERIALKDEELDEMGFPLHPEPLIETPSHNIQTSMEEPLSEATVGGRGKTRGRKTGGRGKTHRRKTGGRGKTHRRKSHKR